MHKSYATRSQPQARVSAVRRRHLAIVVHKLASVHLQEWQVHRKRFQDDLERGCGLLLKARNPAKPHLGTIISDAAAFCNATATQRYLQQPLRPDPDVPRQLSDCILKLSSASKLARVASQRAKALLQIILEHVHLHEPSREAPDAAHGVVRGPSVSNPSTRQQEWGLPGEQGLGHASHKTGCAVRSSDGDVRRGVVPEGEYGAVLECMLVLSNCVESMERECELLDVAAAEFHLETSNEDAEALVEILSIQPFVHSSLIDALCIR
jgi:hypothetical protein